MNQEDVAVKYARNGIKVFPCDPDTKAPLNRNGFNGATCDVAKVKGWWEKHPSALIAGSCDSFVVIDVDDYHVPALARGVIDDAIGDLKKSGLITPSTMMVKTKNSGTHYYFSGESTRQINKLPAIDVLGVGGYVILPDQNSYKCMTSKAPWSSIRKQPEFKEDKLDMVAYAYEEFTSDVKSLIDMHRQKIGFAKKRKPATSTAKPKSGKKKNPAVSRPPEDDTPVSYGVYATSNKDYVKADPHESFLDDNGMLHLDEGMLNSEMINRLFHNREIQSILGEFIGLKVPKGNSKKGTIMRSILPGHIDRNPSFGVRWNKEGTHLICRDFSNYYSDKFQQIDYNIVRLYATIQYKDNVARLSSNEFVTWFLKLMHDAGIVNVDHLKQYPHESIESPSDETVKVIDGFILLDALKRTYNGYVGHTVMSRRFGAAWLGVSSSTIGTSIREAVWCGALRWVDTHKSKKGKPMRVFRVGTDPIPNNYSTQSSEVSMKLEESINKQTRSPFVNTVKQKEKEEENARLRYGKDVVSLIAVKLGTGMHEKIVNFCEDFNIPNPVDKSELMCPLTLNTGYKPANMARDATSITYYIPGSDFRFIAEDSFLSGMKVLFAETYNPLMGELRSHYQEIYGDELFDGDAVDLVSFPISFNVDQNLSDEQLQKLALAFSGYISRVAFDEQVSMILTEEQWKMLRVGLNPELDTEDY